MLSGISITCFAASYAVTLVLEVSRLFFRLPVRWIVMILFAAAGLFAHTVYLSTLTQQELQGTDVTPLATWYDWCLVAAWVLAATYLGLAVRRPENTVGIFLLPLVLALDWRGTRRAAVAALRPRTGVELLGHRPRHHVDVGDRGRGAGIRGGNHVLAAIVSAEAQAPAATWLSPADTRVAAEAQSPLPPVVDVSAGVGPVGRAGAEPDSTVQQRRDGLLDGPCRDLVRCAVLWLAVATLFESLYKPAREGRKVAYITLASFVFLGLVLCLVLLGQHGISRSPGVGSPAREVPRQAIYRAPAQRLGR